MTGKYEQSSKATWLETLAYCWLIGVVALTPLPLASNRPLPAAVLGIATGLLLVFCALSEAQSSSARQVVRRSIGGPLCLFGAVCLWIVLQYVPLPLDASAWTMASNALREPLPERISINPEATLTALMRLCSYAAIFWTSYRLNASSDRARKSVKLLVAIVGAYSLYGIVIFLLGNDTILLWRKWAYEDSLTSTFVNRNNYATFAGLGLLCVYSAFYLVLKNILTRRRSTKDQIVLFIETVSTREIWLTSATICIAVSLILTASRAGILVSLLGLVLFQLLVIKFRVRLDPRTLLFAGIFVGLSAALMTFFGNQAAYRYSQLSLEKTTRDAIFSTTASAIHAAPWTGTGFGTFPDVIDAYQVDGFSTRVEWDKAHNTYLENALELGIPAMIALNLSIGWLAFLALRGVWQRRRYRVYPALGVAATCLVAAHSLVDFSLQIPAVSVLYAFILGLAVAQSPPRNGSGSVI